MHTARRVNASIMWANLHLLFWLSLVPFATGWMGRTNFEKMTVAIYGCLLVLNGVSYTLLRRAIKSTHTETTALTRALGNSRAKEWASVTLYSLSIPIALFIHPIISAVLFAIVAILWLIPSKEIERAIEHEEHNHAN